jgi:2-keto-4-pentenoate hydratase/2-oxohepta-3-ene-1,7-dioic acid hydratase in catechol pathway
MKLVRYGSSSREKPGLLDHDGNIRDLSALVDDIAGDVITPAGLARLASIDPARLPRVPGTPRLGPPVGRVGGFFGIGLNYAAHAIEFGTKEPPKEPIVFMKGTSCIVGPTDNIIVPRGSIKTDWECELGVIIGSRASHVSPARALEHVAGYAVINDVSERAFQREGTGEWIKGKGCDAFGPVGPWLVTRDEVPDPQSLDLWLEVDGHRFQDGNTRMMIFGVAALVSYISRFLTLHPGDIIATGTPPGVGMAQDPPTFLKPGNVVRLGVEGLGVQESRVVAAQ